MVITRASYGKERLAWLQAHHDELMEKAKKVEAQNIDAELEYDLQASRDQNKPQDDQQKDQNKQKEG